MQLQRTVSARARHRLIALLGALAVVAAPLAIGLTPAHAAATSTQVESPDYASETFADPWDFSNSSDINTDGVNRSASVSGGALHVSLSGDTEMTLVGTTAGSLAYGRDGAVHPVTTTRYTHLSFSMNQPFSGAKGAIWWWTCREKTTACGGGVTFPLVAGNHVYDVDLTKASNLLGKVAWTKSKVVSLRLDPAILPSGKSGSASIDWIRLHGAGGSDAAYPPGTYGTTTVTARPEPVVDSPNPSQGADLSAVQNGHSWVFTSSAAARGVQVVNAKVSSYGSTGMTATNAGPHINDPQVHLPSKPFSGSSYHWFSFSMTYNGPFSLSASAGGGKLARLIWTASGSGNPQIGNDMLTYSGSNAQTAIIDLNAQNDLDEGALTPKLGWTGRTITSLRFDPNEDPSANTWHLKSITFRQDPAAKGSTNVQFHDAAWVSGSTATVQVERAGTSTWTTIKSGVAVAQGENSVPFVLGSMPAGSYHARVTITHPNAAAASATSVAPVTMSVDTSHNPLGSLDTVSAVSGGASVSGWGYDPDGNPLTVRLYDGSKHVADVTTSIARPDVQRAHPAAPANSGYKTTLQLAKGSHKICAYGMNIGTGTTNTTLGCKTVTVK
jgi:hypothetical protein